MFSTRFLKNTGNFLFLHYTLGNFLWRESRLGPAGVMQVLSWAGASFCKTWQQFWLWGWLWMIGAASCDTIWQGMRAVATSFGKIFQTYLHLCCCQHPTWNSMGYDAMTWGMGSSPVSRSYNGHLLETVAKEDIWWHPPCFVVGW